MSLMCTQCKRKDTELKILRAKIEVMQQAALVMYDDALVGLAVKKAKGEHPFK